MRKVTLLLAAVTLSLSGCRLFRDDDHPSRSYYHAQPVVVAPQPSVPLELPSEPSGK